MTRTSAFPYRHISNSEQLDALGISVDFRWSDGAGHVFREKDADDTPACKELDGFLPSEMDVKLNVDVTIEKPNLIFGKYASKDAAMGLALQYHFEKLGCQGAMPFPDCTIRDCNGPVKKSFTHTFPKSTFRDVSGFTVLLYIKDPGSGDICFAQNAGAIIGQIDGRAIITGGSGYIFSPYKVSEGPKAALWRIKSKISPMTIDGDLQSVFEVFINVDNPAYPSLGMDSAFFTPLKLEMFSAICTQLIDEVRGDEFEPWDLDGDADGDTVLSHVRYFVRRFLPDCLEQQIRNMPITELGNLVRQQIYGSSRVLGKSS